MARPSERIAAAMRGAAAYSVFRFLAVWVGTGVLELVDDGARWLIVTTTDPGDGSGPLSLLAGAFWSDGGGESWTLYFLAATSTLFAAQAVALVWALRPDRSTSPVLLLVVAIAGLVARFASYGASTMIPFTLSRESAAAVASYSIATSIAGTLYTILYWILMAAVLIVLFARVHRSSSLDERGGPYREPAG